MNDVAAVSAAPQDVSEADLGLEANAPVELESAAEPSDDQLTQEVGDQLEDDDAGDDNLARLERLRTRQSSRETAAAAAVSERETAGEGEAEGEEGEEGEPVEGEEEGVEAAEGDGEDAGDEGIDAEQAQAYLDHLLETFGDKLVVPFKANGEERRATLKEIREQIAPGYMGQDGVHRTLQEATQAKEAATATLHTAERMVTEAREEIRGYAKNPSALVDQVLYPLGGVDALRALRDHLETTLEGIESDPNGFARHHELRAELAGLRTEIASLKGGGQAAEAEPVERETSDPDIPSDLGFIPGKGYPKQFLNIASATLERASKAAGVEFNAVLDAWDAGGRKDDPFAVLETLSAAARRDTPKVIRAKQPPTRTRPQGGSSTVRKPTAARKSSGWGSIESSLASAIEAANRGN